jgi:hypothetical protein
MRAARAFADDESHAQRLYDYLSQMWILIPPAILAVMPVRVEFARAKAANLSAHLFLPGAELLTLGLLTHEGQKSGTPYGEEELLTGHASNTSGPAPWAIATINLAHFDAWHASPIFIEDLLRMLRNLLTFAQNQVTSVRSLHGYPLGYLGGIGVSGFHAFLAGRQIHPECQVAVVYNERLHAHLKSELLLASAVLVDRDTVSSRHGPAADHEFAFVYDAEHAPFIDANAAMVGQPGRQVPVHNPALAEVFERYGMNIPAVWGSILQANGSVQHIDFLSDEERMVFKTSFEIEPQWAEAHVWRRAQLI